MVAFNQTLETSGDNLLESVRVPLQDVAAICLLLSSKCSLEMFQQMKKCCVVLNWFLFNPKAVCDKNLFGVYFNYFTMKTEQQHGYN